MVLKDCSLKVPLNANKTLEARELLRQRQTQDGLVEYLVRWSVCGEDSTHSMDVASTSTSQSDESKQGKDVFLWMSSHALQICCPHLCTSEPQMTNDECNSSFNSGCKKSDDDQPQLDTEELDDMRHDVVKLVNRARKQMKRVHKDVVSKPLLSLSHTIKVLSTYATLGSLSEVFRETGALDLILDLLWTDDADTRRSAGRMLRALALHDGGSRAYVLLSLTQDASEENHGKKHYADFENRDMVMEMFAETASGEEAHAVQLDSLQLPQVPGKALFTLMKCYLRVTSLMDATNTAQGKPRCSWMLLGDTNEQEQPKSFEVAMAIADLINELNRIMDWNNSTKYGGRQTKSKNSDDLASSSILQNITLDHNELRERIKQQQFTEKKHLFPRSLRQSIDTTLLSNLLKSEQPKPMYRHPTTFSTRRQYSEYVLSKIKSGFRVRALQTYQDVAEGDEGVYRQHNDSSPPVQVFWHRLNRPYWVHWHHIVLLGDSSTDSKEPPPFVSHPENSLLWPQLSGMKLSEGRMYGLSDDHVKAPVSEHDIPTQDWWLLLFYADKLSKELKNSIKTFISLKYPKANHLSAVTPDFETAFFVVAQILEQCSPKDKASLSSLPTLKVLIDVMEENLRSLEDNQEGPPEDSGSKEEDVRKDEDCTREDATEEIEKDPSTSKPVTGHTKMKVGVEEYARAVEMGLRISLIEDEITEEVYGKMLMDERNYQVAASAWRMQQDGEKLSNISHSLLAESSASRIIVMTVLRNIAARTDVGVESRRLEVKEMLQDITPVVQDQDSYVIKVYLGLLSTLIRQAPHRSTFTDSDTEGIGMLLATSGHLKCAFDIVAKHQSDKSIVDDAIHCICNIMGARTFATSPSKTKNAFRNLISAIITSIPASNDSAGPSTSNEKGAGSLHSVVMAFDTHVGLVVDEFKTREPIQSKFIDIESASKMTTLYEMLCVLCMVIRLDHSKCMVSEGSTILAAVGKATKVIPAGNLIREMLLRLRGLTVSSSLVDPLSTEGDSDMDLSIGMFHLSDVKGEKSSENFQVDIDHIRSLPLSDVGPAVNSFVAEFMLPVMSPPVASGQGTWVTRLRHFLSEVESISDNMASILVEPHWCEVVMNLHKVIDAHSSSSDTFNTDAKDLNVVSDAVALLYQLASVDKDFAVELCGLECRQAINRLLDKHGSVPKAVELRDLIGSCERQRVLHNKLLAVVLGGCISTALQCVEDARNRCCDINIPLFSQLLDNLCKGADVEMKEEKCWDRIEASTNQRHVAKLTDGNPKTYWESNGSAGGHWVNVYIKKGVVIRKMKITVAQEDSSYMPSRVVVLGGTSPLDVSTQLSCTNVMSTDRELVLLENMKKYWPMVRISIRRCQQGGIDTRIHSLEVVGPKPSFWPILRRQLHVRTSLSYSVQSAVWASEASRNNNLDIKQHKILDVPDKLIAAIEYEQGFADKFLPNSECSTVLGQACRSALSAPLFSVLLKKDESDLESKNLLENLLEAYVDADGREDLIFTSKMRKLCRFLIDLDSGISAPASNQSSQSGSKFDHVSSWMKKVQPRSGKSDGSGSGRAPSPGSYGGPTSNLSKEDSSEDQIDEEIFLHRSHLPLVATCWSSIVQSQFTNLIESSFANTSKPIETPSCIQIADVILSKYKFLQSSTNNVFGPKSHIFITLANGVWRSFLSLSLETSIKLSYVFNIVVDYLIRNQTPTFKSKMKSIKDLLCMSSGTDFCFIFEHFYSLLMMRRLLLAPPSLEVEEESSGSLLSCFPERKPTEMLQDAVYSHQLQDRFISATLEEFDIGHNKSEDHWSRYLFLESGGFSVSLFRQDAHSFPAVQRGSVETFISKFDAQLLGLLGDFEGFYRRQREDNLLCLTHSSNQTLHWTGEGYALVMDTKSRQQIRVTTVQMILLLQFNESEVVNPKAWKLVFPNHWEKALERLIEKKILFKDGDNLRVCDEVSEEQDCTPDEYSSIRALWDGADKIKHHQERRSSLIDCKIVRLMKQKWECLMDRIIEEVLQQCLQEEDGFIPQADQVRGRCEHLINLGYLTRSGRSIRYNADSSDQQKSSEEEDHTGDPPPNHITTLDNAIITTSSSVVAVQVNPCTSTINSMGRSSFSALPPHSSFSAPNFPQGSNPKLAWEDTTLGRHSPEDTTSMPNFPPRSHTFKTSDVAAEIRDKIDKLSEVLAQSVETTEALMLQFEWNSDKLIESYTVARETTLASVGIVESSLNEHEELSANLSCPVCFSLLEATDYVYQPCGHFCCRTCWKNYLEVQLSLDKATTTTCPTNSCPVRPTTGVYREVFGEGGVMLEKYELGLIRSFVDADRQRSWCHNPRGCDRVVQNCGNDVGWCSACGWQTCFACTYVEAHQPASCSHMSQWMDDGGFYEGMNEDARSKHLARLIAKRCPNCQSNIEKNDGCLHMKCAKCTHDFCWRCLQPWRPAHRDYYNCGTKASKLAQAGAKFVEHNKRCRFHHKAKQFALDIRKRLLSINDNPSPANLQFCMNMCTKLAECRKVLAYCNVFGHYSIDSEKLNAIGLHSVALENETLLLQEHISDVLLSCADIQHTVAAIKQADVIKGQRLMDKCDDAVKKLTTFAKQDMKVGLPSPSSQTIKVTDGGTVVVTNDEDNTTFGVNSRPAGAMSDDSALLDPAPSYFTSDDDDDQDDGNLVSDESYDDAEDDDAFSSSQAMNESDDDDDELWVDFYS